MKVLIVKASALGDIIHALPVLAWLKSADDNIEIDWLVEESFAPLLEGHPLIRQVIRLQTKAWRKSGFVAIIKGTRQVVQILRQRGYDVVLDLQGNSKSGFFTWISGAARRYGFARDEVREWPNLLATNRKIVRDKADLHISDRHLKVARTAFPEGQVSVQAGPLHMNEDAGIKIRQMLTDVGFAEKVPKVVLHYGTTWASKLWPLENWQALALRLAEEQGIRPLLTWGNADEQQAAEAIYDACGKRAVVWPRGTIQELTALLGQADLVVGADTGPIHMAAALATPTVSIFLATDSTRNGPRGPRHIALQAPVDCSPCMRRVCELDKQCEYSITVPVVYDSICRLLNL